MSLNTLLSISLCCLLWVSCKSGRKSTLDFADGTYEGEVNRDGQKHGIGIYRWSDGSIFDGNYKSDMRHGKGKFLWSNGESYDGDYLQDQRTGKGTYSWPDGSFYTGNFISGKRHGIGTFSSSSGSVYEGDWFDDMQHGKGKLTRKDGTVTNGVWRKGILLSKPAILPTSSIKPTISDQVPPTTSTVSSVSPSSQKPKATEEVQFEPTLLSHETPSQSQSATSTSHDSQVSSQHNPSAPDPKSSDISNGEDTKTLKIEDINPSENIDSEGKIEPKAPTWAGTVSEAELFFITDLIDGIDTVHYRSSGIPFTGCMRIINDQGQAQGEVNLLNGRLHGEEIFFDAKGEVIERNFWANGRPTG
jgi:hypothetical protein